MVQEVGQKAVVIEVDPDTLLGDSLDVDTVFGCEAYIALELRTKDKPFSCQSCNKIFPKMKKLREHGKFIEPQINVHIVKRFFHRLTRETDINLYTQEKSLKNVKSVKNLSLQRIPYLNIKSTTQKIKVMDVYCATKLIMNHVI